MPEIVRVTGGCQPYNDTVAQIGRVQFDRRPDESVADFERRILDTAEAYCAALVMFGTADAVPDWRMAEAGGEGA